MKKGLLLFPLLVVTLLMLVSSVAAQAGGLPSLDDLDAGWNILEPGGDTICARGTPYSFYVHPGADPNKLMIYFQGGGACWNTLSCRVGGTFDDAVTGLEVEGYYGIFDLEHAGNPIADYNIVFVPYCTGDVHFGSATVTYGTGDVAFTIEHNGYVNSTTVLDWVYDNFESPEQILVTGSSAGAFGSSYHMGYIMNHYADSRVVQFADAGSVGLSSEQGPGIAEGWGQFNNMPDFIPGLADLAPEDFSAETLYLATAPEFPNNRFGQFVTAADEVLLLFYSFSGGADWTGTMFQQMDELEALPNFRDYVAGGSQHTILATPEFYTYRVGNVGFRDWFTGYINGDDVSNVRCTACNMVELSAGE